MKLSREFYMARLGNSAMRRIIKILLAGFFVLSLFLAPRSVYASWREYKEVEYKDLLFYEGHGEEIIITYDGSAGVGHYEKLMRIFVDKDSKLEMIFYIDLVDEHYSSGIYPDENIAFVSDVTFDEMKQGGTTDILVTITKFTFADDTQLEREDTLKDKRFVWGGKILNEEVLGTVRYVWDVDKYQYAILGDIPEKLAEKISYEDQVWKEIEKVGQKIGDKWFF